MTLLQRFRLAAGADSRRIPWLVGQMTVVALLELVTIGGVPPLVALVTHPDSAVRQPGIGWLFGAGRFSSVGTFTAALGSLVLALFVVKVVLSAGTSYRQFRFAYRVQISIGKRMLDRLLAEEYAFFLSQNTSILLKNVTTEVLLFTGGVLIPALQLATQAFILVTLVALVAWVSPNTAVISLGVIGGLIMMLYLALHRRLRSWGTLRETELSEMTRTAHQSLAGIKAVKTAGAEDLFVGDFVRHGVVYARSNTLYQTAAVTPPLLIELALFGSGLLVMLIVASRGRDLTSVLPALALFGVAAYRILPAARLIFAHVVTIRYNLQSLQVIADTLKGGPPTSRVQPRGVPAALRPQREIRLSGVSYTYAGADHPAVDHVSIRIPVGSHVAFVGASGAGKTTVMDLLLGLLVPTTGRILIDDAVLDPSLRLRWQRSIGYVPQQLFLGDATLRENIAFGVQKKLINECDIARSVRLACLRRLVARLPQGLDTPVGENGVRLSGGERQRVAIARALYHSPTVLVLDEATSALDAVTEREINDELLEAVSGLTVVIVAHRLATVRSCDRLVMLKDGRIDGEGTYADLVQNNAEFAMMDRLTVGS